MFSFRKVITKDESTEDENSGTSQGNYNKKVNELRTACDNFGDYLKKVNEKTRFSDIIEKFKDENKCFGKQMKKSQLLSRTSRRLNEMKKKLSKFQSNSFDFQKVDDYLKCFKFKRETPKNGYIKRSAIDDKKVYDFFNRNVNDSIFAILDIKQNIYELNKTASTVLGQARGSLAASGGILSGANVIKCKIEEKLTDIKIDQDIIESDRTENMGTLNGQNTILQQCMTALNNKNEELQRCIDELQKIITNLENEQKDESFGKGWNSLNKLDGAIDANNKAANKLKNEIENTKTILDEVEKNINNAAREEWERLNQTAIIFTNQALKFSTKSEEEEEALVEATKTQNEIKQTLKSIEVNQEIGQEYETKNDDKNALNKQNEALQKCINALRAAKRYLKDKGKNTWDIMHKKGPTNKERSDSLKTLNDAIEARNSADKELGDEIDRTKLVISGVRKNIKEAVRKEKERLDKYADTIFSEASKFLTASEGTLNEATDVKGKIEQTLESINGNKEIGLEDKTENINTLNQQNKGLQQCIEALQSIMKNLKDKQDQIKKVMDNNSTNEEKRYSLTSFKELIDNVNGVVANNLKNEIKKIEKTFDEVEKNIKEIQKEIEKLYENIGETFTKSNRSMDASIDTLNEATNIQKEIEQTLKSINDNKEIGQEYKTKDKDKKALNDQNEALQKCINALEVAKGDLEKKRTTVRTYVDSINYTNEEKRILLTSLEDLTKANDAAANKLNDEIKKIKNANTIAELKKGLENLKNKANELGDKIKNKTGGAIDKAGDKVKNVSGRFFSGAKNFGNTVVRAGKNFKEAFLKEDEKSKPTERQKSSKKDGKI